MICNPCPPYKLSDILIITAPTQALANPKKKIYTIDMYIWEFYVEQGRRKHDRSGPPAKPKKPPQQTNTQSKIVDHRCDGQPVV